MVNCEVLVLNCLIHLQAWIAFLAYRVMVLELLMEFMVDFIHGLVDSIQCSMLSPTLLIIAAIKGD